MVGEEAASKAYLLPTFNPESPMNLDSDRSEGKEFETRPPAERRLRVAVFGPRGFPSTYGGFETFFTWMLPALADAYGHDITVHVPEGSSSKVRSHGVAVRRTRAIRHKALEAGTSGLWAGAQIASARKFDVVLTCNLANVPPAILLNRFTAPVVLNTDGEEWRRGKWGPLASRAFKTSAYAVSNSTVSLVSDSIEMARIYRHVFDAPSTVIPYAWPATANVSPCTQSAQWPPDSYFVVAARWNPENQVDRIAAEYAHSSRPENLLVLGTANYASPVRQALERLANKDPRIKLLGHVSDRATYLSLVQNAAAYLHGHTVGGTNPSLIEAMAVGANIIAYDGPFSREVLGDAAGYFGSRAGSLTELLDQDRLQHDEHGRRRALRQRADTRYDCNSVVEAYHRLLVASAESGRQRRTTVGTKWQNVTTE